MTTIPNRGFGRIPFGRGAYWNCYGTPEGAITEIVGAMAVRRDTGVLYTKTSGSGNTGWAAV